MYSLNRCPGLESRNLGAESFQCPRCGAEVELFSDEASSRCQKCGERVFREKATPYPKSVGKGSED